MGDSVGGGEATADGSEEANKAPSGGGDAGDEGAGAVHDTAYDTVTFRSAIVSRQFWLLVPWCATGPAHSALPTPRTVLR